MNTPVTARSHCHEKAKKQRMYEGLAKTFAHFLGKFPYENSKKWQVFISPCTCLHDQMTDLDFPSQGTAAASKMGEMCTCKILLIAEAKSLKTGICTGFDGVFLYGNITWVDEIAGYLGDSRIWVSTKRCLIDQGLPPKYACCCATSTTYPA